MVMTPKQEAIQALERLPDDADYETVAERLYFVYKIHVGLADLDAGRKVPHEEARRRLARWLDDDPANEVSD